MADAQSGARIERLDVSVFDIPTEGPESDGTLEWDKTTLVVVEAFAGGRRGTGYTYADGGTATVIEETLGPIVVGTDAMSVTANGRSMVRSVRNLGRPGIASMAISAVDVALWDLKARFCSEAPPAARGGKRYVEERRRDARCHTDVRRYTDGLRC